MAKSPRQSLSKAYLKSPVSRPEIEQFKEAFVTMQGKIDPDKTEEYLKNNIRDFLLDAYYKGDYQINVKDRKDLVIHNGPKATDTVGVIIEAKSIKNTAEMVTRQDLNKKALRELILYYLREREDEKNISIKHLIITNAHEWFVFDANHFEKLIYRDVKLLKSYKTYRREGKDTKHFYDAIAKPFIDKIQDELEYTWFDISKYKNIITNEDQEDDRKLVALFKLLSPTHMLKLSFANDSNSLNKNFYNELLHIIGLEEVSQKGKKVIQRKAEGKREPASLLENTMNILKYETNVSLAAHFDTALELCITWVNRVLFLKLLESQLVTYNKGAKSYRFLDYDRLGNYDALNKLFFQVLAIRPNERRPRVQEEYKNVPYLNSSLFEVSPIEQRTLKVSGLEDDGTLSIYSSTVLKGDKGKRAKGSISTLAYLFRFLEAYNFSSDGGEQIQEESKSLINASVLGLIFEKINGYKDGSFFTPGFITMYMCRETIRRSVLQKFREQTDFDSEDWSELKNYIGRPYKAADLQRYNNIIDGIKICDPAVGSGHFLVSALNEIIAIKSELGILCSADYQKLPIIATVDNDELILENDDADNELYEYEYKNSESQLIQKAIFHEKKKLIENCLFGVDINPNSVKICRLRLWIELLKNAYYTEESKYTDLETLPNIDINIKCGNSLISRFGLDSDLKPALKKSKFTIDGYKAAVASYKGATDKEQKREFSSLIQTIKSDFKSDVFGKDKLALQKLEGKFYELYGGDKLFEVELTKAQAKKQAAQQKKLLTQIDKKKAEIDEIQNNKIYENAFEWRFEFPEVLDNDGKYIGFDVVIGNPPYIRVQDLKDRYFDQSKFLEKNYRSATNKYDLYVIFGELALSLIESTGFVSFIIPHKFLIADFGVGFREFAMKSTAVHEIVHFNSEIVFEDASTYTCIVLMDKNVKKDIKFKFCLPREVADTSLLFKTVGYNILTSDKWVLIDSTEYEILNKIKKQSRLIDICDGIYQGLISTGDKIFILEGYIDGELFYGKSIALKRDVVLEAQIVKPILKGQDIKRYKELKTSKYIIYPHKLDSDGNTIPIDPTIFEIEYVKSYEYLANFKEELIVKKKRYKTNPKYWYSLHRARDLNVLNQDFLITPQLQNYPNFTVKNTEVYPDAGGYLLFPNNGLNSLYLLAILNSRLLWYFIKQTSSEYRGGYYYFKTKYLEDFGIVSPMNTTTIVNLVTQIIALKKEGQPTDLLEAKIDVMVYKLYELTYGEVLIVDPDFGMTEAEYEKVEI